MDDRDANAAWSETPPRKHWGAAIVLLLLAVGGVAIVLFVVKNNQPAAADATRGTEGRLTLAEDDGQSLKSVDRQQSPELWYRVLLADAPVGETLSLTCEWVGPDGTVAHRNHYTTRRIDRQAWPTHARYRIDANAAVGIWNVRLQLQDRVLQSTNFEVRDGGKPAKGAL